jgi:hypothetical protein
MLKAYQCDLSVLPNNLSYATAEYEYFIVREVLSEGKNIGEYHIRMKRSHDNVMSSITYLRSRLSGCSIGLVDSTLTLNLEFPIFIKVEDELCNSAMPAMFEKMDDEIKMWRASAL